MQTINSFTTCPADCGDDNLLPSIDAIQDCISYEQVKSQIHTLYIMPQVGGTPSADPFTNFATTPTATAGAISNTTADNTKAKYVVGEGGVGEATEADAPRADQVLLDGADTVVVVEVVIRHVVRVVVIVVVSGRTALVKHGRTARRGCEACRAASAHLLRRRARR